MIFQISSGKGPKECEYACYLYYQELIKIYPELTVIDVNYSDKQCLQSVIFYSEHNIEVTKGTVQWICCSPFRPHHKRKNWFIDISILEEKKQTEQKNNIRYETMHSRGKGGQNVNKVATAVRAIHIPTGISVVSMNQRSQMLNRKTAYVKLMQKLELENNIKNDKINYLNWNKHNQIVRGQPVCVYKGMEFKRIK